jgi:hypothetical protein
MFEPAIQLHIHSPGGRTYAKAVKKKEIKVDEAFHAREAAKKLKRKVSNSREAQNYLDAEAARIIPHAPKSRKRPEGIGRGAPGEPRSDFSREVIRLFNEDVSEKRAVQVMLESHSFSDQSMINGNFKMFSYRLTLEEGHTALTQQSRPSV